MAKIDVHISPCLKEYAQTMKEILQSELIFYTDYETCVSGPAKTPEQLKACQTKLDGELIGISQRKAEAAKALAACNGKS